MWENGQKATHPEKASGTDFGPKVAYFYSADGLLRSAEQDALGFVTDVRDILTDAGYVCVLVGIHGAAQLLPDDQALHIWMSERPPSTVPDGFQLIHCFPSYFYGFWYFDIDGVRNNSSIRRKAFNAGSIDGTLANTRFNWLQKTFVDTGKTKFDQPDRSEFEPPQDSILIATQGFATPHYYPSYVEYPDLIDPVIKARDGREILIKPHPLQGLSDATTLLAYSAEGIHVEPANLHLALSKVSVVVTRCSAVAIEAMLHRVPAVVTAQVDFHHCVTTATDLDQITTAVAIDGLQDWPFEKYLSWFLWENLFEEADRVRTKQRASLLLEQTGAKL